MVTTTSEPTSEGVTPPACAARPFAITAHGDERVDPYHWLRERDNPDVIAYLEAENAYTNAYMAPTEPFQARLFEEIKRRIQETDLTPPARRDDYWYYSRTVEGSQYSIHCRKHGSLDADETMMLDENELAGSSDYFALGALDVSPDHRTLAYSTDYTGAERYTVRFREIERRRDLDDEIEDTYYSTAWASDGRTLFYVRPDAAMRPWQVWRHVVGTAATADVLVYQENDDRFFLQVAREKDGEYITVFAKSKLSAEVRVIPAADPTTEPRVIEPRQQGVEYFVHHHRDRWLILTNAGGAQNFKLVEAPEETPGAENWKDVIPHDPDVRLASFDVFRDHVVLYERGGGVRRVRVMYVDDGHTEVIEQPESVYVTFTSVNPMFHTTTLRYGYSSLTTPNSIYDYDMDERTRVLVKEQPVLGGYDRTQYETVREWATANDGERIPISLVYKKGRPRDGTAPALIYGYGSYEASSDPGFSSIRLSLLDRGFVVAIAHVRGGGEMGRRWYDNGKLLAKANTFTDFIACAEHLVAEKYTSPERLVARGASAGGLLMGAIANLRPDLFHTIVAEVPFVDVVTTILDESLPLTVTEWEEWGNPVADAAVYEYMKSYSPYDNVEAKEYPNLLVTGGLNDPRVQYWEPAKWVAKLRATKTDDNALLLKMEMGAGHGGPSGRYDAWKDEAFVYAFILRTLGITD